jgi:hypothetical protein
MGLDLKVAKRPKNTSSLTKKYKAGIMVEDPAGFIAGMVGDRPSHIEYVQEETGNEYLILTVRVYIPQDAESDNHESVQMAADIFTEKLRKFDDNQLDDKKGQYIAYLLEALDGQFGEEILEDVQRICGERLKNGGW